MSSPSHRPDSEQAIEAGDATSWPLVETLQSTFVAFAVGIAMVVPRLTPVVIGIAAGLTLVEAWRSGRLGLTRSAGPLAAAAVLIAWALLSSRWASDRALALSSVAQVGVQVAAAGVIAVFLPGQIASLPRQRRMRFLRAVPIGFLAGLGFLAIEFATNNALSLAIVSRFPEVMGDNAKDFVRNGKQIVGFLPFYLDRNVVLMTLALPGVWLCLRGWLSPRTSDILVPCAMLVALAIAGLSYSAAAKLAAFCGAVIALTAWVWPRGTRLAMVGVLAAGVLLALPLARIQTAIGLDKQTSLPPSTRERILIWSNTAEAVAKSPFIGIGAQSTRFQDDGRRIELEGLKGPRRALGWHTHNMVLQTWFELGAIGAALLVWLLAALALRVDAAPVGARPAAAALLAMTVAVAVTGWGMWQPWLAGGMVTALAALVTGYAASQSDRA